MGNVDKHALTIGLTLEHEGKRIDLVRVGHNRHGSRIEWIRFVKIFSRVSSGTGDELNHNEITSILTVPISSH